MVWSLGVASDGCPSTVAFVSRAWPMRRICRLKASTLVDHGLLPWTVAVVSTVAVPAAPVERGRDVIRGVETKGRDVLVVGGSRCHRQRERGEDQDRGKDNDARHNAMIAPPRQIRLRRPARRVQ